MLTYGVVVEKGFPFKIKREEKIKILQLPMG
jgi:hypothetical protein